MRQSRFWQDKRQLLRQFIAAWVVLLLAVILFVFLALLLSSFVENRETTVLLSFIITLIPLISVHVLLKRKDYHLSVAMKQRPDWEKSDKINLNAMKSLIATMVLRQIPSVMMSQRKSKGPFSVDEHLYALLRRTAQGDTRAFEDLYKTMEHSLIIQIRSTGSRKINLFEAEEIAARTMLGVAAKSSSFVSTPAEKSAHRFIFEVAVYETKRWMEMADDFWKPEPDEPRRNLILVRLTYKERMIFIMRVVRRLSYEEIAKQHDISQSEARKMLKQAISKIAFEK
jgi:RNA polymerase sigma factor (sigma-70 family)